MALLKAGCEAVDECDYLIISMRETWSKRLGCTAWRRRRSSAPPHPVTALIGAGSGAAASLAVQVAVNHGDITKVNYKDVAVAAGVGLVAGAFAPVVAGNAIGAVLLSAGANVIQYVGTQYVDRQTPTFGGALLSGALGAVAGRVAGPIARYTAGYRYATDFPGPQAAEFKALNDELDARANATAGNLARAVAGALTSDLPAGPTVDSILRLRTSSGPPKR